MVGIKVRGETLIRPTRFDVTFSAAKRFGAIEWLAFQLIGLAVIIIGRAMKVDVDPPSVQRSDG